MKKFPLIVALGLAVSAGASNAAFINGSISFSDGFDTVAAAGATSIVSELTAFDIANPILVNTPLGDFLGTASATAFDFDINALPIDPFFTTDTGFSFQLDIASIVNTEALVCTGGLCTDAITLAVGGIVSGIGFDDTVFLGSWTANGSCAGNGGGGNPACNQDASASWSASLTAIGEAPEQIPEPASVVLLGLGLLGLVYHRRNKRSA